MSDSFLAGFCVGGALVPALLFVLGACVLSKRSDEALERKRHIVREQQERVARRMTEGRD